MTSFAEPWLLDTNILLRTTMPAKLDDFQVNPAMDALLLHRANLYYTSQNFAEFWNVCTRPLAVNGFGLSIDEADRRAAVLESRFTLAPDSEDVHHEWRRLIVQYEVSGSQVHDARIVATRQVNSIRQLLTLNTKDFRRYPGIVALTPSDPLFTAKQPR